MGWEDPLEKEMTAHCSILLGESYAQGSLVGYSPWGCKGLDMPEATEHAHRHTSLKCSQLVLLKYYYECMDLHIFDGFQPIAV